MNPPISFKWVAFAGKKCIASGPPRKVAVQVKAFVDVHPEVFVLIFDARSSQPVELDLRGSVSSVLRKIPREVGNDSGRVSKPELNSSRGPGRPKLGVLAREVTLLPRHWDWLASQPGGASVVLRKLVEEAQRSSRESDRIREAQEAAYRFMHAMAGDEPGFEEAARALFANDLPNLRDHLGKWPRDVRRHMLELIEAVTPQRTDSITESSILNIASENLKEKKT